MLVLHHAIHKKKKLKSQKKHVFSPLESVIYVVSFVGPFTTLPQIYDVWIKKNAAVSTLTWTGYLFVSLIWLIYGLKHKEGPIIVSNALWVAVYGIVLTGVIVIR